MRNCGREREQRKERERRGRMKRDANVAKNLALSWIRDVHPSTKRHRGRDRKFEVSKEACTYAIRTRIRVSHVLRIHDVMSLSSPARSDGPRNRMRPLIFRRLRRAISFLESNGEEEREERDGRRKCFPGLRCSLSSACFSVEASLKWLLTISKKLSSALSVSGLWTMFRGPVRIPANSSERDFEKRI